VYCESHESSLFENEKKRTNPYDTYHMCATILTSIGTVCFAYHCSKPSQHGQEEAGQEENENPSHPGQW
jgi:hypothetical protein